MAEVAIPRVGNGVDGGKARGYLQLVTAVQGLIARFDGRAHAGQVAFPETRIVTTSVFREFLAFNGLEEAARDVESGRDPDGGALGERLRAGRFPEPTREALAACVLGIAGPLAIRSSSLLEDRKGASFAGKYASVFVVPRGDARERLDQVLEGVKAVFASTFNPDALAYRANRGVLLFPVTEAPLYFVVGLLSNLLPA